MITFEQARQIVAETRGALYDERANFSVEDWGWETPERWIVEYYSEAIDNHPVISVDKVTGECFSDPGVPGDNDPFPEKTPVGQ